MEKPKSLGAQGFTLIELLIVLAVIGILIGLALPRFKGMQDEGNIAKAKGELRTLQTAIESIYVHTRAYPAAMNDATLAGAVPQILAAVPDDPFRAVGSDYKYARSPDGKLYTIMSVGPGGGDADTATIANTGVVTQTVPASNIYVSNANTDNAP